MNITTLPVVYRQLKVPRRPDSSHSRYARTCTETASCGSPNHHVHSRTSRHYCHPHNRYCCRRHRRCRHSGSPHHQRDVHQKTTTHVVVVAVNDQLTGYCQSSHLRLLVAVSPMFSSKSRLKLPNLTKMSDISLTICPGLRSSPLSLSFPHSF